MKELQQINPKYCRYNCFYNSYCDDPLLDYVQILAEEYRPATEDDWDSGYYCISPAIGMFAARYLSNKIKVGESALDEYLKSYNILNTIKALGYDIEKFWYLTLFINDYSYGYCFKGTKLNNTPREDIEELFNRILGNINAFKENEPIPDFERLMEISFKIEGKHKFVINNPVTIFYLAWMCKIQLDEIEKGGILDDRTTRGKLRNGRIVFDTLSNSKHVYFFAKMFLSFFKLFPSKNEGTKNKRINKRLLISQLVYIMGISKNENFLLDDKNIKGYLNLYKDEKDKILNMLYL